MFATCRKFFVVSELLGPVAVSRSPPLALRTLSSKTREKLTESYYYSLPTKPLIKKTVGQALDEAATKHPGKEAFVFVYQNIRKTFEEFRQDVQKAATGFLSIGIKPGDRLGIWGPNSYEWILTQVAAAKIGAVLVNINPGYRTSELLFCINKVGMKGIVSAKNFKTQDYYAMLHEVCPELEHDAPGDLKSKNAPSLRSVVMMGENNFKGALNLNDVVDNGTADNAKELMKIGKQVQFDDPVNIQFTSGTTGFPKGCTLTHFNLLNNAASLAEYLGYNEEEHTLGFPIPLYHTFATTGSTMTSLISYTRCVFPAPSFEPDAMLKAINDEGITSVYATPTIFIDMLNHPNFDKYNYDTLVTGIMGGAPCPSEVVHQLQTKMGIEQIMIAYGLTETSPGISITPRSMPPKQRTTCVGMTLEHQEVKIVDSSSRKIVPVGVQGELCVRGYNVMIGYWDDEEKTREAIDDAGWLSTGDLATIDEDGVLRITGRIKDMIIRGGENIYPTEIEQFLYTNPKVAEAQVVGIPDERMGEEVCACLKLKAGETATQEEIINFCKGKITHFKIPRYVVFVNQFSMTITGKVKKFELIEQMANELKQNKLS